MLITSLAVRRPVAVVALFVAVAVAGLMAYFALPINWFPRVNIPVVTIVTAFPGAGPEEVELQVSRPIEDAVAGLNDLDVLTSVSAEGVSQVVVRFTERADNDLIATAVERQVNAIVQRLPSDAERPTVLKIDYSQIPVAMLAVTGGRLAPEELYRLADEVVRPELERLRGVANVGVIGGRQQELRVAVDPDRLRAYGLSLAQVQAALQQANLNIPGGTVSQAGRSYSLRLFGLATRPEQVGDVVVGGPREAPVRLRDLAEVRLGAKDASQISRVNRQPAVTITVGRQNGANLTDVADGLRAALPQLHAAMPPGSELKMVWDGSTEIRTSLDGVRRELITAVLLTAVVLLLFLHRLRVSLIVLLSIPTTLLATLVAMRLLDFSFNILTTLGLTLTIGILVDDSIVVLENILRRLAGGDPPEQAAINGRAEIGLAAIAITLVDVVVFVPVGLVTGQIGSFFREFGFTIAAATLFSLVVSFTLTPMLAGRLLRRQSHADEDRALFGFAGLWNRGFLRLERGYRRALQFGLGHRLLVVLGAAASLAFGVFLVTSGRVPTEFFPRSDQGRFIVSTELPPGTSLARHDELMSQVEARLMTLPEVETIAASVGAASFAGFGGAVGQARLGEVTVDLVPKSTGRRDVYDVAEEARAKLSSVGELKTRVEVQGAGGPGQPLSVRVQGPDSARLTDLAAQVQAALRDVPGLRDVTNSVSLGSPELRVTVDEARAQDAGVTVATLGQALRSAYAGGVPTKYRRADGKQIDVRVSLDERTRTEVGSIADLPVPTANGGQVRLGQIAKVEQVKSPSQIDRRGRQRLATLGASIEPGYSLGEVLPRAQAAIASVPLPPGYSAALGGDAEEQQRSFGQLFAALGASIVLAYLLMAILYDSFVAPIVILFSLPVAVGGAIGALWVFGYTFNIFAMIGLILLVGLAIKNGILLVDRANHNRAAGMTADAALLEAGPRRLRPILMTSTTIALALLPTALRFGEGSELRAPLAAAVLGGVITSTLLTLMLIPVVYSLTASVRPALARVAGWRPGRRRSAPARRAGRVPAGLGAAPRPNGATRSERSPSASGSGQSGPR
ncbi:MAG TPA: efflux RND transporter permease subunit [Chloroflexota bacterium]